MIIRKMIVYVALIFTVGGCAIKQKYDYYDLSATRLEQKVTSDRNVYVITKDSRPYVLNGDKKPSFMGLTRIYGAPVTQNHPQGQHASLIYANQALTVLKKSIPSVTGVAITDKSTFDKIIRGNPNHDRWLTFEIFEWKYDSPSGFGRTSFYYDVELTIYGTDRVQLASHRKSDKTIVEDNQFGLNYANAVETVIDSKEILEAINQRSQE